MLVLPFLPAKHIPTTLEDIATNAKSARTKELATHGKKHLVFIHRLACTILEHIHETRQYKDVEGWHKAVESNKPFNELPELLHTETTKVRFQVKLIGESKLKRCQPNKVRAVQGQIFSLWVKYTTQTITTAELFKKTRLSV